MRIISGKYRSLVLAEFKGEDIRPTADRVKESLFNIIAFKVPGSRALDLFCGSGGLGLECLSRGAEYVHFNDVSPASIAVLNKNLARIREKNYKVTTADFSLFLADNKEKFDLIFLDPPYKSDAGVEALEIIALKGILSDDGIAVLERDRPFAGEVDGLRLFDERKYGKTYLSFFEVNQ